MLQVLPDYYQSLWSFGDYAILYVGVPTVLVFMFNSLGLERPVLTTLLASGIEEYSGLQDVKPWGLHNSWCMKQYRLHCRIFDWTVNILKFVTYGLAVYFGFRTLVPLTLGYAVIAAFLIYRTFYVHPTIHSRALWALESEHESQKGPP